VTQPRHADPFDAGEAADPVADRRHRADDLVAGHQRQLRSGSSLSTTCRSLRHTPQAAISIRISRATDAAAGARAVQRDRDVP
jgi:hypothetical protein